MDDVFPSNSSGIITLQCGHYSNFVGTHWWNIQNFSRKSTQKSGLSGPRQSSASSSGLDPLFRDGSVGKEDACTPRLVCIDLKGSLKTLREDGQVYDDLEEKATMEINHLDTNRLPGPSHHAHSNTNLIPSPCDVSVHSSELYKKNQFLNDITETQTEGHALPSSEKMYHLDDIVDVWSDYLGTKYHHNSLLLVDRYTHHGQDSSIFNSFNMGLSMDNDDRFWDAWEDKMHFFAEECDTLQGFQVVTDLEDGFGGLGTRIIQNLRDVYGAKAIAVFGCWPGSPSQSISEHQQIMNTALSVGHLIEESSVVGLMSLQEKLFQRNGSARCLPYVNYKADLHYHSSVILASYLDSITQHYRIGTSTVGEFCNNITKTGHKIASCALALPLATRTKSLTETLSGIDCLYEDSAMQCLTPSQNASRTIFSHQIVLRGFPQIYEPKIPTNKRIRAVPQSNAEEFERYLYKKYSKSLTGMTFREDPLVTAPSYPQFFDQRIKRNGFLDESGQLTANTGQSSVTSVPTLASLYTSSGFFDTLHDIIISVRKIHKSKIALMEQSGIEPDEIRENLEILNNLAERYDEKQANTLL